ncbi:beta-ketoacyl synthase N-terminal-like domain-containing protein [Nostoc sp. UHCC 0252]|nr:polyketide synthase [Nostoc sp. UHCC 0252]MEA5605194.1 beta-ketoacyl synthase N-terminal-like domain-containing protein [Nostoc sp. UHCC 0252]
MDRSSNVNHQTGLEIAIIGISGRFPGAKNADEFWQNLQNSVESIAFYSDEELLSSGINSAQLSDPNYIKAGAILEDVEFFDAAFFGFTPREAEITDPQHRIFLESAWEALENAGYDSETYEGSIGVYAGASLPSYLLNLYSNQNLIDSVDDDQIAIGIDKDYLATRVSYKLNLEGPSYTIQTACSTSLVAVHLACQSLLSGECDMALAGGVSIQSQGKAGYVYVEGGISSPDGHCRAFDAKAQGTISGDGVGIVVLKRLEDAINDRDTIYAVIKGSATNNDGSFKLSYTAPRIDSQAKVIRAAQLIAEVEPETITYVETHGTGTVLGDPIEIAALTQAFRAGSQKKGFCAIGSVKTNIGHLDTAAGVAGLIKTALAFKNELLPPSLHFEEPNSKIDFANSPFYVNSTLSEWKSQGTPRRAGVSSFGVGGTNVHVVLEEAPTVIPSEASKPWQIVTISAKTKSALEAATTNLVVYLKQHPEVNLADVAYTLNKGRRAFNYRRVLVCKDIEDIVNTLSSLEPQRVLTSQEVKERSLVFMFPGQGAQYVNMTLELYQTEPTFRQQVDLCVEILKPHLGLDLKSILYPSEEQAQEAADQLQQTAITQPALFVIEYALAKLWMSWGIHPAAMIGHSIGEYVAGCLAGVFSLEDALSLVAARGKLMQLLSPGSMLAVPLPENEVQPLLNKHLSLAAINGASLCVVSGLTDAVEVLQNQLANQGVECRRLHTSHAFHSQMVEPILKPFTEQVKKISLKAPQIPYLSNVTGTWITAVEATDPSYWSKHLRQTVQFAQGLQELLKEPNQVLLEVGPGRVLSTLALRHPDKTEEQVVVSSVRHPQDDQSDVAFLLTNLAKLWLSGVQVNWSDFYTHEQRYRLPLPTYPFERQRYWIELQKPKTADLQLEQRLTSAQLWQTFVQAGQLQASSNISALDRSSYLANKQWLDRLCIGYIHLALHNLGVLRHPEEKYSLETLFEKYKIIPRYQQLLYRWLNILVEQGQLQQEKGLFYNLVPLTKKSLDSLLEEVKVRRVDAPQMLKSIQICGEHLAEVLIGEKEPLELYLATEDDLYTNGKEPEEESLPLESPLNSHIKAILRSSVEAVVKSLPPDVNLRILEIGGGIGIATAELLPILPPQQTNYTFTDVGGLFLKQAQQRFSDYPFVEYRFLDIEKLPIDQGYSLHSFDLVLAVNVLHVTRNMAETLEHVRSLLAPGGFLLLWEITQPQLEFDIGDGLLMNPLEDEERSKGNPFLSKEQWQKVLHEHGFVEVVAFSETEAFGEQVLVAQASTFITDEAPKAFTVLAKQKNIDHRHSGLLSEEREMADWFYIPSWKRSIQPQSTVELGCCLVFVDECGFGEKIVQRLRFENHNVVSVKIGDKFHKENEFYECIYTINPRYPEDYHALLKDLCILGKAPKTIVHLWSVTSPSTVEDSEKYQAFGFYSLLFLTQAIAQQNITNSVTIEIVSNNLQDVTGTEILYPEKALIMGPCQVVPQEYPHIVCQSIDIILPHAESWEENRLVDQLLREFNSSKSDSVIAYRGHHRWVQTFEPVQLQGVGEGIPQLRQEGVYLITDVLEDFGLAVAEYLAHAVQAKLILLTCAAFPQQDEWEKWLSTNQQQDDVSYKIRKLQAIAALGVEIMILSPDLSNSQQLAAAIKKANHQFGQIHGVIHTATVSREGIIQVKTKEAAANAMASKVIGTRLLESLFQEAKLDFFILCSSLVSFDSTLGMLEATASNAFLDAFARYSNSRNAGSIKSINWDRWHSLDLLQNAERQGKSLTFTEGVEAFKRILATSNLPQIAVSKQDFLTLIQQKHCVQPAAALVKETWLQSNHLRPHLENTYVASRNEVERSLTEIWQELLGIKKIGIYDNFFELGGDSLFATQLVSRICKKFEVELPYKLFFNAPTIAELAEAILARLTDLTEEENLAQILADIENLSEDEAQVILTSQD